MPRNPYTGQADSLGPLFDRPAPHNRTETSIGAAHSIRATAARSRGAVFRAIQSAGSFGATDAEIQTATGLIGSTERPRRGELVKAGLVRDSGERRRTSTGRLAVVWVVA